MSTSNEGFYTDDNDDKQDRDFHAPILAQAEANAGLAETAIARAVLSGVPYLQAQQLYGV